MLKSRRNIEGYGGGAPYFGKEESAMLGGIAILLMMWHHLFNFPEWYAPGVEWNSRLGEVVNTPTRMLGKFGSICIQIFAMMSGYALMKTTAYSSTKKRWKKLVRFMGAYWLVFALFILVGWLNDDALPSGSDWFFNLIGVTENADHIWVPFAWYVGFYIEFIILAPVMLWAFRLDGFKSDLIACLGLILIVFLAIWIKFDSPWYNLLSSIYPILSVAAGMLCAKYNFFEYCHSKFMCRLPSICIWILMGLIILVRYELNVINSLGGYFDVSFLSNVELVFIALAFMVCCVELINRTNRKWVRAVFIFFGSISLYLWFMHGIFFVGKKILMAELYYSKEPLLIYLTAIFCLVPIAWIVYKFYNFVCDRIQNSHFRR